MAHPSLTLPVSLSPSKLMCVDFFLPFFLLFSLSVSVLMHTYPRIDYRQISHQQSRVGHFETRKAHWSTREQRRYLKKYRRSREGSGKRRSFEQGTVLRFMGRVGGNLSHQRYQVRFLFSFSFLSSRSQPNEQRSNHSVNSYYFMSSAFLPLLAAASKANPGRSAAIVNISSISGITRTTQHHPAYNVSKAATIHLNTLLAQEFSQPGVKVRVNR